MLSQQYPSLEEFRRAFVVDNGNAQIEQIRWSLYDRVLYPTAGLTGALAFFQAPIGNGQSVESGAAAGVTKSLADTNMTQQGQLPAPQAFWVDSVQLDFDPGSVSTANLYVTQSPTFFNATAAGTTQSGAIDKHAVLNAGFVTMSVGTKNYLQLGPLRRFPPAVRERGDTSSSMAGTNAQPAAFGTQSWYAEGAAGLPVYVMNPGISIPTAMNFAVNVNFPVAIATGSGFNGRIQVLLDGFLLRAIQ